MEGGAGIQSLRGHIDVLNTNENLQFLDTKKTAEDIVQIVLNELPKEEIGITL